MSFYGTQHLFVKAINQASLKFPASKADIILQFGDIKYEEDLGKEVAIADVVRKLPLEYYNNGAEFWASYAAYLAQKSNVAGL